ncbi:MAG: SCO1664 family protein [Anaerolineaceae bacterium]|nr:SCO1664 family protein [Anaerolineaceae bacterium]
MNKAQPVVSNKEIELALQHGSFALQGEFLYGSNRTFLCDLTYEEETMNCVYKPARGERPLWDFETGSLPGREAAAYLVDTLLGWHVVPPCVIRNDGPFGLGSLHWFIEHDPQQHYFTFTEQQKQTLQRVVLFDVLINNADRKGGHFLLDAQDKIWLIDHGLCFHTEDKLRTVIWDFAGEAIPEEITADMKTLQQHINQDEMTRKDFLALIDEHEFSAIEERLAQIVMMKTYPAPSEERRMIPWPLV